MHKGQRVRYEGTRGVLVGFHLGQVGGVDEQGNGVLLPAMVGAVRLDDGREVADVPLSDLHEEQQPDARSV